MYRFKEVITLSTVLLKGITSRLLLSSAREVVEITSFYCAQHESTQKNKQKWIPHISHISSFKKVKCKYKT